MSSNPAISRFLSSFLSLSPVRLGLGCCPILSVKLYASASCCALRSLRWCNHSVGFFPVRRIVQLNQTSALIAAEFYPNLASVGIIGQILVESAILTPAAAIQEDTQARWSRMLMSSSCRKDSWDSRKDALLYFQNKRPWSRWDPRVLSLYIVRSF